MGTLSIINLASSATSTSLSVEIDRRKIIKVSSSSRDFYRVPVPEFWREFFEPRYKKMPNLEHDHGVYLHFHSDDHIIEIIPDSIEVGVNVLNQQFSCHRLQDLADVTRGKACIASDIDRQYILPKGSPEELEAYIKRVIDIFGCGNKAA